jgi:hypothetical protein
MPHRFESSIIDWDEMFDQLAAMRAPRLQKVSELTAVVSPVQ